MNWLNPEEVEAWLNDKASVYDRGIYIPMALEQFVEALAALDERPIDNLTPVIQSARLLKKAMEEKK